MEEINQLIPEQPDTEVNPAPTIKNKPLILIGMAVLFISAVGLFIAFNKTGNQNLTVVPVSPTPTSPIMASGRNISELSKKLFPSVEEDLLKIEFGVTVEPEKGYQLVASLLSPDKTQVAFSEVSQCFTPEYVDCQTNLQYSQNIKCTTCDWNYRLIVRDLKSGSDKIIFNFNNSKPNTNNFVKTVHASAIPQFAPFALGWVNTGNELITKNELLQSMAMGVAASGYNMVNTKTGKSTALDENIVDFSKDFSRYITIPGVECGEGAVQPYGETITVKSLPEQAVIKTIKNKGEYYGIPRFGADADVVEYVKGPISMAANGEALCLTSTPKEFVAAEINLADKNPTPTNTMVVKPTPVPVSMSTYRDAISSINVSYPNTWSIESNSSGEMIATFKDKGRLAMTIIRRDNSSNEFTTLEAYGKTNNLPLRSYSNAIIQGMYAEISGSRRFLVFSPDKKYILSVIIGSSYPQEISDEIGRSIKFK